MRILTYLHSFEPGGVERIALRLVREWRAAGIDAPLVVGRAEGAMAGDVGDGLTRHVPPRAPFVRHWKSVWMIVTLLRAVRRARPDVIFCAGNTYAVVAVALKLLLGRACPPVVAKISNDLDRREAGPVARWCFRWWQHRQGRWIDHFIAMSPPARNEVAAAMGVPATRVSVVANPVLSERLVTRLGAGVPDRPLPGRRFVALGRLAPQKNLALMLRAFAAGARSEDTLTLYGTGRERARLAALADALGIARRVRFGGYVADPAAVLPGFDCLLLSSDYEGVPAVVVEALAAGLAIVATDCSRSMTWLLDGGALGTLVPPRDPAAFAAAIARADRGAVDRPRAQARARDFMIERVADEFVVVMRGAIAARTDRARIRRSRRPILAAPVEAGL